MAEQPVRDRAFRARFASACSICERRIAEEDWIVTDGEGGFAHLECAEDDADG